MPVVALRHEIEVEAKAVHLQFAGPRQREAPPRRMGRIVDVERLTAAVARSDTLDFERDDGGDRGRALQPIQSELDRFVHDAAEVGDQVLADKGWRPTRLSADDRGEGLPLRLIGPLIDDAGKNPIAV